MKANVTVKGFTNIILVLNMKRFVNEERQTRFERLRRHAEFADVLQNKWPSTAQENERFQALVQDKSLRDSHEEMSPEEIGFAAGLFRAPLIEDLLFPTYKLRKEGYKFPDHLTGNYQFKNLFQKAWDNWQIRIRPSYTGLFVICLTRPYKKATPLMDVVHDVIRLQESLDVQSARKRLEEVRSQYADHPGELISKEASILQFLEWLGTDDKTPERLQYAPVQWKLAMEVCRIFVDSVGFSIPLKDDPIKLTLPRPKISTPLHDSYAIYHFDEMWADRRFSEEDESESPIKLVSGDVQPVRPSNIRNSLDLQQQLASLIEGALLKKTPGKVEEGDEADAEDPRNKYAPRFQPELAKRIIESDVATWEDELCLLTPRAALILPSRRSRDHELLIATLPGSTSRFKYARYWDAVEYLIEFITEIHVLSRLLERRSLESLERLASIMDEVRNNLYSGDIQLHTELPEYVKDATHLRRLTALCQALGDPYFWNRAEYATGKADLLMRQLGLPRILDQIERNTASINSVVDHVDEWYMADLTEQSNDMGTLLTLGLAAVSFILTLLILPSFLADLEQIKTHPLLVSSIRLIGIVLALMLMVSGAALSLLSLKYRDQIKKVMDRSLGRFKRPTVNNRPPKKASVN
ncbi:MAG: hypothetical protein M5U11_11950 [Anaerolineales bacterium]|nr:hypothetical protein [Anaerolineales bacterium]